MNRAIRLISVICAVLLAITGLSTIALAAETTPQRFFLDFVDAYLVYVPDSGTLQIAAELNVLSYGSDWEVAKLKPYLYHMRLKTWKGFYWKVNTSRKQAWIVRKGTFGKLGGDETLLKMKVEVVGGGKSGDETPTRFLLKFPEAYLVYVPGSGTLQIITEGNVLSYGGDWEVAKLKPYLYHMREKFWKDFYWKVNTSRKQAWRVKGGTFGKLGGTETLLKLSVRVVE
jgi:hypothetical protein